MIYEFRAEDGEMLDIELPVAKAPKIGSKRVRKGKVFKRVPSYSKPITKEYQTVSSSLPRKWPFAKDWDEKGKPRFKDKQAIDDAMSRATDAGEAKDNQGIIYDR